jgi:membrane-associated phospholipid phosphatase
MTLSKLRVHEWMLVAFFAYVAAINPLFQTRPALHGQPYVVFAAACLVLLIVSRLQRTRLSFGMDIARDWLPIFFIFLAFREMDYFAPREYDFLTEMSWIRWDLVLLEGLKLSRRIESLGPVIPFYLELCYLLVYAVGAYCVARLSALAGRKAINRFWTIFLLGTLGAYALFPYFPTEPPRFAFTDIAMPGVSTVVRELNWYVLGRTTIHSGVFPSAHVSASFSAAFGMFLLMPKRRDGWWLLIYAVSVSIAVVYGRYHYLVDALAGFGISLLAAALCFLYYAHDVQEAGAKTSQLEG